MIALFCGATRVSSMPTRAVTVAKTLEGMGELLGIAVCRVGVSDEKDVAEEFTKSAVGDTVNTPARTGVFTEPAVGVLPSAARARTIRAKTTTQIINIAKRRCTFEDLSTTLLLE